MQVNELFLRSDKDFSGELTETEFREMCKVSKFLTGESLLSILDDLTRVFAQRMGDRAKPAGGDALGGSGSGSGSSASGSVAESPRRRNVGRSVSEMLPRK